MSDCLIIAEVGSNWLSREDCHLSIDQAAKAGADAVKFQLFTTDELYGPDAGGAAVFALPWEWVPGLRERCDQAGVEFMCTTFSPSSLLRMDSYVKRHKLASSDASDPGMVAAARATSKPVLFSTGGQADEEVARTAAALGELGTALYCVGAYPARSTDLRRLHHYASITGRPVGYSDHTLDFINAPRLAVHDFGATVIEKHFTAVPAAPTPDRKHSLDPMQFTLMVDAIRGYDSAPFGVSAFTDEADFWSMHKRRLIALQPIAAGERFTTANVGSFRAREPEEFYIGPHALPNVLTLVATRPIKKGASLTPGDLGEKC